MNIRTLTGADAEAFKAIRIKATQEAPTTVHPTEAEETARPLAEFHNKLTDPCNRLFGAFQDDQLVGITGLFRNPENKRRHSARIGYVYLCPEYRSQGIAKQLLSRALDYAASMPDLCLIKLAVHTNNRAAQHLYAAVGFTTYATEPKVLCIDGQFIDEHLMLLSLR